MGSVDDICVFMVVIIYCGLVFFVFKFKSGGQQFFKGKVVFDFIEVCDMDYQIFCIEFGEMLVVYVIGCV